MRAIILAFALVVGVAGPALAQGNDAARVLETRIGDEGFESPPATLDQLHWLIGQWAGAGIQGAPAMESWLSPAGGTMVGTFVQEAADGSIMFTEHMYLMEDSGSLALKLKHFNADLTGWEEKGDMLTFRLVAIAPCAAYFHALTLRCADPTEPGKGLVAAVRMQSDAAKPQELVFRFEKLVAGVGAALCPDATTTVEINLCHSQLLTQSNARHKRYMAAAQGRYANQPERAAMIAKSEAIFEQYRDQECRNVHQSLGNGSIRTAMFLDCLISLTDARTKTVWQNWLTYGDSTPAILPEPAPTR